MYTLIYLLYIIINNFGVDSEEKASSSVLYLHAFTDMHIYSLKIERLYKCIIYICL